MKFSIITIFLYLCYNCTNTQLSYNNETTLLNNKVNDNIIFKNNQFILSAFIYEDYSTSLTLKKTIYQPQLFSISENAVIFEDTLNEIECYFFELLDDSVFIYDSHLILDSFYNFISIPFSKHIFYQKGKSIKKENEIVLKIPKLINIYRDSIDKIIKLVQNQEYTFNEKDIYLLYMGAQNNYKESREVFLKLYSKLEYFDGALKETFDELYIPTIWERC